jgi:hypothetical protein
MLVHRDWNWNCVEYCDWLSHIEDLSTDINVLWGLWMDLRALRNQDWFNPGNKVFTGEKVMFCFCVWVDWLIWCHCDMWEVTYGVQDSFHGWKAYICMFEGDIARLRDGFTFACPCVLFQRTFEWDKHFFTLSCVGARLQWTLHQFWYITYMSGLCIGSFARVEEFKPL